MLYDVIDYNNQVIGQIEAPDPVEARIRARGFYGIEILDVREVGTLPEEVTIPQTSHHLADILAKLGEMHDLVYVTLGLRGQSLKAIEKGFTEGWNFLLIARNADMTAADWDQDHYGETFQSYTDIVVARGKSEGKPKFSIVCRTEAWQWLPEQNGLKLTGAIPIRPFTYEEVIKFA